MMKTATNTLASLLAAAIWADGEFAEAELTTAQEIAEAFEIPQEDFRTQITAAMEEVQNLSEEDVTTYAVNNAAKVDPEEAGEVYLALMQMMICDGVLTGSEVYNLLTMAEVLDIDRETAVLLLCDMVKTEPELEISFEPDDNE